MGYSEFGAQRRSGLGIAAVAIAAVLLLGGTGLAWAARGYFATPSALYQEARGAAPARAAALYQRLGERLPQIEEYTALWAAEAAMPDVAALRSIQDVIAFRPQSPAAYEGHVTLARYYAGLQAPQAKDEYQAALALTGTLPLRLELAHYLEGIGDASGAYDQYLLALNRQPDAFAGVRRTGRDPLVVAKDLIAATYFNDAVDTLRISTDPKALPLRAQALAGAGRYAEAEAAYHEALKANADDKAGQLGLARVVAQQGRADEALALYEKVDSDESRLAQADLLAVKKPDQALALYQASPFPVAWWSATALLESQKRLTETLPLYARVAQTDTPWADDAAYRMYVVAGQLGDKAAQAQAQGLLAKPAPDWLASKAAGGKLSLDLAPDLAPAGREILDKARALDLIGRSDLALQELALAARFQKTPEVALAMAQALAARGAILPAQNLAAAYIAAHPYAPAAFWQLSYPRPYSATVESLAAEYQVDPLLMWAVMRAESVYDPSALSGAGARGLMQIMPDTQSWIAEQLKADLPPGAAFTPDANIRMGAWYLRYLLQQFKGDTELAIAAYNGGQGSVANWLSDPQVANRDDWLRWIGFGQTREYLERVGLNYEIYKALYGAANP